MPVLPVLLLSRRVRFVTRLRRYGPLELNWTFAFRPASGEGRGLPFRISAPASRWASWRATAWSTC
jgi:hypothetical protein